MNIVEIDLRKPTKLKSFTLSTIGTEPALGLVAVTAELDTKENALPENLNSTAH